MTNPIKKVRDHFWVRTHASEYIDGEMSHDDCHRLEEHRSICPKCRQLLQDLVKTIKQLAGMKVDQPAPDTLADDVIEKLNTEGGAKSPPP